MEIFSVTFLLIGLILFTAAFNQGLTGFGFALTSIPLISLVVGIKYAVPLGALAGFVVNILLSIQLRKSIDFKSLRFLYVGSFIGIPIGVFVLSKADPDLFQRILGIVILLFVIMSATNFIKPRTMNLKWGYLFGLFSGMLGGAFNTNGPPVLIYFYLTGKDKLEQKSAITGFFIVASVLIIFTHAVTGLSNSTIFLDAVKFLPFIISGYLLGTLLFKKVSSQMYSKLILFFLFVISVTLIIYG